ncbi:MAG: hypothetical protein AABY22_28065, partial [Nanoarchaeota archaeon]
MNKFDSLFENYNFPLYGVRLPSFEIDNIYKERIGLNKNVSNYIFLSTLCNRKLEELISSGLDKKKEYEERLRHELKTIEELGFVDYILLVWDITNYCNENNIPLGLARGSSGGSLVLFLINVTKIDPIKNDLYFERFISKTRAKKQVINDVVYLDSDLMCDIDIDVCYYNRPKLMAFLEEKFKGKTCKISTVSHLQSKLLIKECGKVVSGLDEEDVKQIASLIPQKYGHARDIEVTKDGDDDNIPIEEFKEWCEKYPESYEIALRLRGLVKNKSIHASAILISYDTIEDNIPTEVSTHGEFVSSYDMKWATKSNVKLDLLGLRAVSIVDQICKKIGIRPEDINTNDPIIYQNLQSLRSPHGLFQIEAETAFKECQKIKPKNLEELSGVLAIARPGALQFSEQYAKFTNTGETQSIHPFFDDVLGRTGGILIYQEQLMKLANKIGFSLEESETLRRIVGKKLTKEMKEWEEKLVEKVKKNKLDPKIKEIFWKILEDSANYSFCAAHSFSYATLCAITAYLMFKDSKLFYYDFKIL